MAKTNTIGDVTGIKGTSIALNNQRGDGAQKPVASGNDNPNDTKPPKPAEAPVVMPK
jgi:hypothetical protein